MTSYTIDNILIAIRVIQSKMSLDIIQRTMHSEKLFSALQAEISSLIHRHRTGIGSEMSNSGLTAADLAIRSRRAYQWLGFLSQNGNLADHLDALQRLSLYWKEMETETKTSLQASFYHQGALFQVRQRKDGLELKIQESYITAPDTVLNALLMTTQGERSQDNKRTIREYTFTEEYQRIRRSLEYMEVPRDSFATGKVFDLRDSFNRVNKTYFKGDLAKPGLVWNNRLTHRKFGHYQWDTDTVMISSTLDQKDVPTLVLDYVMYHELLHKKLGTRRAKHNRISHTREFRVEEGKFHQIEEAQKLLNRIARKQARS